MRAGPKAEVTAPPLDLSALPTSGGDRVVGFGNICGHQKGTGARQLLRLRPWQVDIVRGLFDDPRPRQGLVSIPRGNGKSTLAAALGLYGLFADGVEGAQVLSVATLRNSAYRSVSQLGSVPLRKLDAGQLNTVYGRLLAEGKRTVAYGGGDGLSPRTVRSRTSTLMSGERTSAKP